MNRFKYTYTIKRLTTGYGRETAYEGDESAQRDNVLPKPNWLVPSFSTFLSSHSPVHHDSTTIPKCLVTTRGFI